jgi:hypothetical protein
VLDYIHLSSIDRVSAQQNDHMLLDSLPVVATLRLVEGLIPGIDSLHGISDDGGGLLDTLQLVHR